MMMPPTTLSPLHSEHVYMIVDHNWQITDLSPSETRFSSTALKKATIGDSFWDTLPPAFSEQLQKKLWTVAQRKQPFHFVEKLEDEKSLLHVEMSFCINHTIILLKDKTCEIEIEEALDAHIKELTVLTETSHDLILQEKPQQLFDTLFAHLSRYLDLDVYFNYRYSESGKELHLMNYTGISADIAARLHSLQLGEAICGKVAADKQKRIAEHIITNDDPSTKLIRSLGIKAYVCHPLISNNRLLGTLSFGSKRRSTFTESELLLIDKVCRQVAAMMERLFFIIELKEKNNELVSSNELLLQAKQEAEKAHKAKTDFLSMMSHELRTPLNSILGFSQILLLDKKQELTEHQVTSLTKIVHASRHLLTLINQILELVRIEAGKPAMTLEKISAHEAVTSCIKLLAPFAESKYILIHHYATAKQVPAIKADKIRFNQVILNLLSNAIKYNYEEGQVSISYSVQSDHLTITIADTGFGLSQEDQAQMFKAFYRSPAHASHVEGSGIGLTLVQQLLTEMGGSISFQTADGIGSKFSVKIPLYRPEKE
ncbi:GAF domain-containing sensor histidine kinase [Alkalihalobacillus oceani]|uniref:histidine kinase n=1 Tax=Halalkalibacter oceani TaxID=1653776 RepID=A0A9X2DN42_9BACI|nr:GAF domain-containing sensor histidine kinase [Halalkalibacter oceani]MCM3713934.1 GAF domain-containing sensor histidine kinase [Halalkalibacter oceani]